MYIYEVCLEKNIIWTSYVLNQIALVMPSYLRQLTELGQIEPCTIYVCCVCCTYYSLLPFLTLSSKTCTCRNLLDCSFMLGTPLMSFFLTRYTILQLLIQLRFLFVKTFVYKSLTFIQ